MRIHPTLIAVTCALAGAVALPAAAQATLTVSSTDPKLILVRGDGADSVLTLTSSGSNAGGHLTMTGNPESMTLSASNAAGCVTNGGASIICNPIGGKVIDVDLGGGKATVTVNVSAVHAPGARIVYRGGSGVDLVNGAGSSAPLDIGLGAGDKQTATGGSGPDTITGSPVADTLNGGGGDDVLDGGDGNDLLAGGAGADRLQGGPGNDVLDGGDGNDPSVDGGFGDDSVAGGKGDDVLLGSAGDDSFAGADDDGADTIDGGEGVEDVASYAARTVPLALSLNGAADDGAAGEQDNLLAIESLAGGQKNDTISGSGGTDFLSGGLGDDHVDGGEGIDFLRGNDGDDVLIGRDASLFRDDVGCNLGADTAVADANDVVASDCETLDRAPLPAGIDPVTLGVGGVGPGTAANPTGAGPPAAVAPVVLADGRAPRVTVAGLPAIVRRGRLLTGLRVRIATDEAASLDVRLVRSVARAAAVAPADNLTVVRRVLPRGSGARTTKLLATPGLLGRGRKTLKLIVVATDAAGNRSTLSRTVRVR